MCEIEEILTMVNIPSDEERYNKGAGETTEFLKKNHYKIEMAIVLDITGEGYEGYAFTIENYKVPSNYESGCYLRFKTAIEDEKLS